MRVGQRGVRDLRGQHTSMSEWNVRRMQQRRNPVLRPERAADVHVERPVELGGKLREQSDVRGHGVRRPVRSGAGAVRVRHAAADVQQLGRVAERDGMPRDDASLRERVVHCEPAELPGRWRRPHGLRHG